MTTTSGSAKWQGGIKDGKGAISTKSGALSEYPYGFASRFEGKPGSNPEELIGAAHAACFTMALSLILGEAKLTAEHMETKADVTLEKVGDGFAITSVHLDAGGEDPRRGQREIPGTGGHGEGRLPGVETAEYARSRWTRRLLSCHSGGEARNQSETPAHRRFRDSGVSIAPHQPAELKARRHLSASPSGPTEAMRTMLVVPACPAARRRR